MDFKQSIRGPTSTGDRPREGSERWCAERAGDEHTRIIGAMGNPFERSITEHRQPGRTGFERERIDHLLDQRVRGNVAESGREHSVRKTINRAVGKSKNDLAAAFACRIDFSIQDLEVTVCTRRVELPTEVRRNRTGSMCLPNTF